MKKKTSWYSIMGRVRELYAYICSKNLIELGFGCESRIMCADA